VKLRRKRLKTANDEVASAAAFVIGLTVRAECHNRASTCPHACTLGIEPRKPVGPSRMRGLRQS